MIKNIIFDFDGVILDSVAIKTEGYKLLFKNFDKKVIEKILMYHKNNGGISRYEKIKYFFNELLKQTISEKNVQSYANKYSVITKEKLSNPHYLIKDTVDFINMNHQKYNMHIASGADEDDLRYICNTLELTQFFKSINGSPIKKNQIIYNILNQNNYLKKETILVGDSINDFDAAKANDIGFYGYNNKCLRKKVIFYIENFNLWKIN